MSPAQSLNDALKPWTVIEVLTRNNIFHIARSAILVLRFPVNTYSQHELSFCRFSISMALALNGTVCSFPAFIRAAGIVHSFLSKSISAHVAPRASEVL